MKTTQFKSSQIDSSAEAFPPDLHRSSLVSYQNPTDHRRNIEPAVVGDEYGCRESGGMAIINGSDLEVWDRRDESIHFA